MKLKFSRFFFILCAAAALTACSKSLEESRFDEFEMESVDGSTRKGGVYLPKGYNPKKEYPVIYMEDGLVFKDCKFAGMIDSLIDIGAVRPVVIACSYENKLRVPGKNYAYRNAEYLESLARSDAAFLKIFNAHLKYFQNSFIPYVEKNYSVSHERENRIYFGTSNSADWGLTLSMKHPELFAEYWCFSPVSSDISTYGMLEQPTQYRICWGIKEEVGNFDYFPSLVSSIRKRGGKVQDWSFNGGHDREWWKYLFGEELVRRFPVEKQ